MYQCGLRFQEALNIRPKDIDGGRLLLRVRATKGGKERMVPITAELCARLRKFWEYHCNPNWLFPGFNKKLVKKGMTMQEAMRVCEKPLDAGGIYESMKRAKHECGLMKRHEKVTPHTLRHSYATHMLEAGCSVNQVSTYLGHKDLRSTLVYLHLTEVSESKGRDALRTLATGKQKEQPR